MNASCPFIQLIWQTSNETYKQRAYQQKYSYYGDPIELQRQPSLFKLVKQHYSTKLEAPCSMDKNPLLPFAKHYYC